MQRHRSINEFRHKLLLECEASQARLPTGELTEVAVDSVSKEFRRLIADKRMVILAVGLGGNTGSGAAPVLARFAQEEGLEVVALVTLPFEYEAKRRPVADAAMAQLEEEGIELIIHDHSVESRRGQAKNESFNDYLNGVVDSFSGKVDVLL